MSLADSKRDVFTTIGSYTSLIQDDKKPKQTDSTSSINNKGEIVPFLLDILKTVAGTEVLKELIGLLLTKLIKDVEPSLKIMLKKQFIHSNSNEQLPNDFKTNGITLPVKSIDIKGKFKVNPNSETGNLIYGSPTNTFDSVSYNAILNSGTYQDYNNMSIKYNQNTDSFQIKPNSSENINIGKFFENYIDNTELINEKEIISNIMDGFYGTLVCDQNKTIDDIYNQLSVEMLLQQVLDGDDSFVISPNNYYDLLNKAREFAQGVVSYDLGCGLMSTELNFNDFNGLISNISGSTDPFYVGNQIENSINQSSTGTTDQANENKETIRDKFFQRIINIFILKLLEAVTTAPQIRVLFGMISALENNGVININNPIDDIKKFKIIIKCMAKEIIKMIVSFIFSLAVTYLIKLIKPVIKKVTKEKINQYSGIIKSLSGLKQI